MATKRIDVALIEAVEADDFESVRTLAAEFGKTVLLELSRATEGERARTAESARETLTYCLSLMRIARSHLASQLRAVDGQSRYSQMPARTHTWQFEA